MADGTHTWLKRNQPRLPVLSAPTTVSNQHDDTDDDGDNNIPHEAGSLWLPGCTH